MRKNRMLIKVVNSEKFYINTSKFIAETAWFDPSQTAAYFLLLIHHCTTQKPIPNDDKKIARLLKITPKKWEKIKEPVLDNFEENSGLLYRPDIVSQFKKMESVNHGA